MFWRVILIVFLQLYTCKTQSTVQVQSKLGDLEGIKVNVNGNPVYQFLNIPYANPPVGDLRFKKPVPTQGWQGVYNATAYGPSCMQVRPSLVKNFIPNVDMSEDCLSLNIYVPHIVDRAANKSVMVWIHGGGFLVGEAEMYDGSNLALIGDVIIVTVNYRLGVFGFLNTGDQELPGNYGIWDQLIAIKMVKENILEFGGNPNSITIFGESAGAFSVSMLLLSPPSEGLFQRVIGESGTCLTPSFVKHIGIKAVESLAKVLSCPLANSGLGNTIGCLRNTTAEDLLNITNSQQPEMFFGPVIDGDLIPDYPERLLGNKSSKSYSLFLSRDILFGINSAEGGIYMLQLQKNPNINISVGISSDEFCQGIVPNSVNRYFNGNKRIKRAACEFYKANNDIAVQARNTINFLGDIHFAAPTTKVLNLHSVSSTKTYQYIFSQQTSFMRMPLPTWYKGANHADELGFVFGMLNLNPVTLPGDQHLADQMMTYWTNFAKFGDPNGLQKTGSTILPHWPTYFNNKAYMNFSHNAMAGTQLFQKRMEFWLTTVPSLGEKYNTAMNSVFG